MNNAMGTNMFGLLGTLVVIQQCNWQLYTYCICSYVTDQSNGVCV